MIKKKNSIPLRQEDLSLIPYIMTAPDRVEKSSVDATGRESVRFYKDLSNRYVVVVEKEYKNSPDDMETITMWAEMSDKATNARQNTAPDTHVQNAILDIDAVKIRKDAENAIRNDEKLREQKVSRDAVEARAKAGGTYMKAPNGKQSNLSPSQWVQVRTKAFKDWFGDWELSAKVLKIISGIKEHGFNSFEDAKAWAKENIVRTLTNEETGDKGEIRISNVSSMKYNSLKIW